MAQDKQKNQRSGRPVIEWIAGGIGLVLTLVLFGFVGWQAVRSPEQTVPEIDVRVTSILPAGEGFLVEIIASNHSMQTAASVQVEGVISRAAGSTERSSTTFDYVPGHSEARGGLFFSSNPANEGISLRALGYHQP